MSKRSIFALNNNLQQKKPAVSTNASNPMYTATDLVIQSSRCSQVLNIKEEVE
jgi:hypothetical protein